MTEHSSVQPSGSGSAQEGARAAGEEIDLGAPPPRPKQRRFAGTVDQISGSLLFYKIFAFVTGVMLLLLVVKMVADYGFGLELYIGGMTVEGTSNTLGLYPEGSIQQGTAVSYWVAVVHGWIYVVYLIAGFRLWYLMSWTVGRLAVIVLGGVVPFLSFIVEKRISREVRRELEENPAAARRY